MKKLLSVLMALMLLVSLAACSSGGSDKSSSSEPTAFTPETESVSSAPTGVGKSLLGNKPEEPADSAPEQPEEPSPTDAVKEFWDGYWYGWWIFTDAAGAYSGFDDGNHWYDCCAEITVNGDKGSMVIWDENFEKSSPLAKAQGSFSSGSTDAGRFISESGRFTDMTLGRGTWIIDPGDMAFENLLCIEGDYVDPDDSSNTFSFRMYLRPWGQDWSDLFEDDPDYWRPYFYDRWYLPMLSKGELPPDVMPASSTWQD